MKTIRAATVALLALSGFGIVASAAKPKTPKQRILIACPEPDHYVDTAHLKGRSDQEACRTLPNVQPTDADLIWSVGKVDVLGPAKKP